MLDKKRADFFSPINSVEQLVIITVISLVIQIFFYRIASKFAKGYINNTERYNVKKEKRA